MSEPATLPALWRRVVPAAILAAAVAAGCGGPDAPEHPTWVNVQPIVRAQCVSCHGATAPVTGAGYRFDFFDMDPALCGDATKAMGSNPILAHDLSSSIWDAITTTADRPTTRPRMPPEPAAYLDDWQWQTIKRWNRDMAPKGEMPHGNTAPRIQLYGALASADQGFDVTAVVDDADGDPVVGVIEIGDFVLKMDRGGAFSQHVDTSTWTEGPRTISTVLCDGWASVHYLLGTMNVSHAQ